MGKKEKKEKSSDGWDSEEVRDEEPMVSTGTIISIAAVVLAMLALRFSSADTSADLDNRYYRDNSARKQHGPSSQQGPPGPKWNENKDPEALSPTAKMLREEGSCDL